MRTIGGRGTNFSVPRGGCMKLVSKIFLTIEKINYRLHWFGIFCVLALTFIIIREVIMRYFFNSPSGITVELARALQNYMGFLCAGYVQIRKAHLNMEDLLNYFSPKTKNAVLAVGSIIGFLFCGIMGYYSWLMVIASYRMGDVTILLEWPMTYIKAGTLIGYILLGLQYIVDAWNYYHQMQNPSEIHKLA
jgi:TRAP-type C4-dicarboxylate transport system permease small subunit